MSSDAGTWIDAFDMAGTAFVVTDVQNDFADPSGSLYVTGGEEIIPLINEHAERARTAGCAVIYTQDWHPVSTPHFAKDGGIWPVHCVGGTWGARFHPALAVNGQIVRKGAAGEDGYSGFSVRDPLTGAGKETLLRSWLWAHAVTRIVITGIATDYCVLQTALDGLRLGFEVVVPSALVRAVDLQPGDGERALARIGSAGGTVA
jgi:nicotinamidase/pyrazinamidase